VPSIVRSIHGFANFPWLFSIYLLSQAVTVPVYGKLADHFGRKPVMLLGIALFFIGSLTCGAAWSMTSLICARLIQGLGAGAVQPMTLTIVGDLYSLEERARVQGYIASVWGISSVVGLALGGVFSEYASWRWIFFINLPLCLLAAFMIASRFHETVQRRDSRVDRRGALVLTSGLSLLILGVLEGGQAWPWASAKSLVVLGSGIVLLAVFVVLERQVSDPMLPAYLLSDRLILTTSAVAAGVGAIMLGLSSYVPTFVQDPCCHAHAGT
jgi:multidrug resistance protein